MMHTLERRIVDFAELSRSARPGGDWGDLQPRFFECKETDVQFFFLDLPREYVFVFPGTDPRSAKDWTTNFMFAKRVIPYGNQNSKIRVHRGFLRGYKSVRKKVHGCVRNYVTENKPIVVVGHSQGGAFSFLGAVDIQWNMREGDLQERRREVYAITFGAPRVGNKAFRNSYVVRVKRTWRYAGAFDVVTRVPFAWLGFRHVGQLVRLACRHDIRKYIRELKKKR